MNFVYKDGLQLLYSGKELLAKSFYFNINNFLRKHTYHPNMQLNYKEVVLMRKIKNYLRWKGKSILKTL